MLAAYLLITLLLSASLLSSISLYRSFRRGQSDTALSLKEIYKLVNSQKTALLREVSELKTRISKLLPGDEGARQAAEEARDAVNGRALTDAMIHQAVEPLRKK